MTIPIKIENSTGTRHGVKVTKHNQLVVAPLDFSTPTESVQIDVVDTAFNLQVPITGKMFILTDFTISTDKNVNVNGGIVRVYQSEAVDSLVEDKTLLVLNMNRQDKESQNGLNWSIDPGRWLNARCDEINVDITVAGYYVDA